MYLDEIKQAAFDVMHGRELFFNDHRDAQAVWDYIYLHFADVAPQLYGYNPGNGQPYQSIVKVL